jgi:hypothetical protein
MSLRICLVTPFSWSQPHDVNEHVGGMARELRRLGHGVTVLAPSNRADDLRAGRRALLRGPDAELIALGPALPISRRSHMGVPVGVRANLALALARGGYDVVHGFEPGLPSLSYLALRDAQELAVASFFSAERLAYPPGRTQRERLLGRIDALIAASPQVAEAASVRFPGDYRVLSPGVDVDLFRPASKTSTVVLEWRPQERARVRMFLRALEELDGWELVLLRTNALTGKPYVPRRLRERIHVRTALHPAARAAALARAAVVVPAGTNGGRLALEAGAAGAAVASSVGELLELARDEARRAAGGQRGRAEAERQSFRAVAGELDRLYRRLASRRRAVHSDGRLLQDREWILCDLHTHTSWSYDCGVSASELLAHAEEQGLGAIAVTDHNVFGGALEAVELARGRRLTVIPGEEVKTDGQGEVIGLFLSEEIPRGRSFADTIAAIRAQGGLVYLPHPFDRRHAIPDPATLHRHLADIDVFEVYNARLLFEAYNDDALRFARKYNLTMGAGSDAHVLPGLGTGVVRMRAFRSPEEFLISLRTAQVLRRPRSLAYLQSLKWMAQVKEKVR